MVGDQVQHPPCVHLTAADGFAYGRPRQNDHHNPSRPNDVDMREASGHPGR